MKFSQLFLLVGLAFFSFASFSPYEGNVTEEDAVGVWLSENSKEKVRIFKRGDKYYGKMIWMENEYDKEGNRLVDKHNPDPKLRGRPMVGIEFLIGFKYVGNGWFTGGQVYDMDSGSTYSARIHLPNKNTAKLRGYIGIPLFGRTEVCTKVGE